MGILAEAEFPTDPGIHKERMPGFNKGLERIKSKKELADEAK